MVTYRLIDKFGTTHAVAQIDEGGAQEAERLLEKMGYPKERIEDLGLSLYVACGGSRSIPTPPDLRTIENAVIDDLAKVIRKHRVVAYITRRDQVHRLYEKCSSAELQIGRLKCHVESLTRERDEARAALPSLSFVHRVKRQLDRAWFGPDLEISSLKRTIESYLSANINHLK